MHRNRLVSVVVGVLSLTLVAGCGGSSGGGSSPTQTVKTYLDAVANGNGGAACAVLTPSLQTRVVKLAKNQGTKVSSCSALFGMVKAHLTPAERNKFLDAKISTGSETGSTARVRVSGATDEPVLTKTGGRWYISGGVGF